MASLLLSTLIAAVVATQTIATRPTAPEKNTPPLMTMTGCVSRDATASGSNLFSETRPGATDRPSGFDLRKDADQRGQIVVGTGSRRVTIRGGLVPSPNVAAQAGALDPGKAAIGGPPSAPGGMGTAPLPEFRAEREHVIAGSCP
jgi:hypothetical protein